MVYRALHVITYETRDRMIWEALDELAHEARGHTSEVLERAAEAVLSEEALGAHMADRNEERVRFLFEAMQRQLATDLDVEAKTGFRRGIFRPLSPMRGVAGARRTAGGDLPAGRGRTRAWTAR